MTHCVASWMNGRQLKAGVLQSTYCICNMSEWLNHYSRNLCSLYQGTTDSIVYYNSWNGVITWNLVCRFFIFTVDSYNRTDIRDAIYSTPISSFAVWRHKWKGHNKKMACCIQLVAPLMCRSNWIITHDISAVHIKPLRTLLYSMQYRIYSGC